MQATRVIIQGIKTGMNAEKEKDIYISNPVIRIINEIPRIAVFLVDTKKAKGRRPEWYITTDIDNGRDSQLHDCRKDDFSSMSYNRIYDAEIFAEGADSSEEFYDEIYEMFDSVRQSLIEGTSIDKCIDRYDRYMSRMLRSVPIPYRSFYEELSNFGKNSKPDEEYDKTPAKQFEIQNVRWRPQRNLSTVPETIYKMAEKIAEHIRFLPTDSPAVIRYEYPFFCTEKDRSMECDPWQEILIRLRNDQPKIRHYQATVKKKSIYTTCPEGQNNNCLFEKCPYFIAAYIRYLKDNYPEELKKQREEYNKERYKIDATSLAKPKYDLNIPTSITKEDIKRALSLFDSGMYMVSSVRGGYIKASWIEDLGSKGVQLQNRTILRTQINRKVLSDMVDVNGQSIDTEIINVIYAHYLLATGGLEKFLTDTDASEKENDYKQEEVKEEKNNPVKHNEETTHKSTEIETKELKQKKDVESTGSTSKKENTTTSVLNQGSMVYRCLTASESCTFYGIYQYVDSSDMAPVNEIFNILKSRKLVDKWKMVELKNFADEPDERTFYIVNKIGTTKDIPTILETFIPNRFVLLCGEKQDVDVIMESSIARAIYGKCVIRGRGIDPSSVCAKLRQILPDNLKKQITKNAEKQLAEWLKDRSLPINSDKIAEFIAWQCILENQVIFTRRKEKNNAE